MSGVIEVELYTFRGFAFEPGDISIGEGESRDVIINSNGKLNKIQISQPTITFTIKGAIASDVESFDAERSSNIRGLLNRNLVGETIPIAGKIITNAWLAKVTPSAPMKVGGIEVLESVQLEFRSQDYQFSTYACPTRTKADQLRGLENWSLVNCMARCRAWALL